MTDTKLRISPEDWDKVTIDDAIVDNPITYIEAQLGKLFPDMDFCFPIEESLGEKGALGYELLTGKHWEMVDKKYNAHVPSRVGLVEREGAIRWREHFVMFRPKWLTKEREAALARGHRRVEERMTGRGDGADIREVERKRTHIGKELTDQIKRGK